MVTISVVHGYKHIHIQYVCMHTQSNYIWLRDKILANSIFKTHCVYMDKKYNNLQKTTAVGEKYNFKSLRGLFWWDRIIVSESPQWSWIYYWIIINKLMVMHLDGTYWDS